MAGFNVSDFSAIVRKNGLMRTNKFLVRIPYPVGFENSRELKNTSRYAELWCDGAAIPGINIKSSEVRRYGYGPTEQFGVAPQFDPITLTFISDNKAAVHAFFYKWTKLISNHDMRTGGIDHTGAGVISNQRTYELQYKNTYVSDIEITVFSEDGSETMKVTLRNAYPTSLGDVQLNWTDTNDFVRLVISLAYTDYYVSYLK